jgi:hypothetical protein
MTAEHQRHYDQLLDSGDTADANYSGGYADALFMVIGELGKHVDGAS